MENNRITLNEEQLAAIIRESVNEALVNEGFWNNLKAGVNTFKNGSGQGIGDRWKNAVKNYHTQGELDDLQGLISQLSNFVDDRVINPNITVGQLIGGKYNNNRFGRMSGLVANRKSQMRNRGYSGNF